MKKILDRIPRPPGSIPARAQIWLLVCLTAAIAITLVSFPGEADGTDDADSARTAPPGLSGPPSGVAVTAVDGAARRMREEAARRAEQRLRAELGDPAPRPDGLPHPPQPLTPEAGPDPVRAGYPQGPSAQEQIEREERLRQYQSLRSPPLVQSARTGSSGASAERPRSGPAGGATPDAEPRVDGPSALEPIPAGDPASPPPEKAVGVDSPRTYVLREGEFLEAVLANRLSGDFVGPVTAMVSADVYDRRRRRLLVPRGTRAVGQASRVEDWEQSRLAVLFHRLILPDGNAIELGESVGLNQIGETGLRDRVDRRYPATLAAAGAVGALAGLSQAVSPQEAFASRLGSARFSAGTGLSRAAERILDRYLNRLPRLTVREGHRIRIYLTKDLEITAYDDSRPHRKGDRK